MADTEYPLITFYKGWSTYQRMLVDVVAPLSSAQLALSVTTDQWTIGGTIQHIVANRVWWFQLWTGEGSDDLAPIMQWDPSGIADPPKLAAAELVAGLTSTWGMIADALGKWTPADLLRVFSAPAVLSQEEQEMFGEATLQWIIWHVLEHEIHHGGEISLVLGNYGLTGIYGAA